jgi:hypothetical protein
MIPFLPGYEVACVVRVVSEEEHHPQPLPNGEGSLLGKSVSSRGLSALWEVMVKYMSCVEPKR